MINLLFFMTQRPPPVDRGPFIMQGLLFSRRNILGRTPLDEWSARHRDLYLTTQNTHSKHPCPRLDSNPQSQQARGRRPMP